MGVKRRESVRKMPPFLLHRGKMLSDGLRFLLTLWRENFNTCVLTSQLGSCPDGDSASATWDFPLIFSPGAPD
jgi:hypothetical protein